MAKRQLPLRPRKAKRVFTLPDRSGYARQLPNGVFEYRCKDSDETPIRRIVPTLEEAISKLESIAAKNAKGGYRAEAAHRTFNEALDLVDEYSGLHHKGASQERVGSVVNTLREAHGHRKLSEFWEDQNKFIYDWLVLMSQTPTPRAPKGRKKQTLAHYKSSAKRALDEAIAKRWMAAPNPFNEFPFKLPDVGGTESEPFTLDQITGSIIVASVRDSLEHELVFRSRYLLLLIGLRAGLRPGETCGLCWDMINLDLRMLWIERVVRIAKRKSKGDPIKWELVDETKTTRSGKPDAGKRMVPIDPLLHAALVEYRDRLREMGRKTEGRIQVLATDQTELVTPYNISEHLFPPLRKKVGLPSRRIAYALRTSFANLLRMIRVPIEEAAQLMGHGRNITTTAKDYYRNAPSYAPLKHEVREMAARLNLDMDSNEGAIDALGFVLAYRIRAKGCKTVKCSEPRSSPQSLFDHQAIGQAAAPLLLSGDVLDLVANSKSVEVSSRRSLHSLTIKEDQRAEAKARFLAGVPRPEIARELGISTVTLNKWLRAVGVPEVKIGRLKRDEERALRAAVAAEREHCDDSGAIGRKLGIEPHRVTRYENERGYPMPHRPGAHKIGRYENEIDAMRAAGMKDNRKVAAELKRRHPREKTPSHSGISYFLARRQERYPGVVSRPETP